ncbi:MAG: enoyl-CoA hydratase/isomerase family protein [Phycisphaerales bacterium JB043]
MSTRTGFLSVERATHPGVCVVRLERGKVNALIPEVLEEFTDLLGSLRREGARSIVLTGSGSFFSFGFDVPHMLDWTRERFGEFLRRFCALYRELFLLPIPVVGALNGHAVAGGCLLALTVDQRVMARGKAKISLNEVTFGASIFAGAVEMARFQLGDRVASRMLLTGEMFDGDEALRLGIVDRLADPERVVDEAIEIAAGLGKNAEAYASLKRMLRTDAGSRMESREEESIESFLDIWYSPETRQQLELITIR